METYKLTLKQTLEKLKKGEVSPSELTKNYIDRIKSVEPDVDALNETEFDEAIKKAKQMDKKVEKGEGGILAGVPYILKDNMCTKGLKTTCSSKILNNFVPPYNATVVDKLEFQGAILLAKANMDEFAMGSSTENSAFKKTNNPFDLKRVPGGSSGGSAASVAAGEAAFALGSDTGGSIRQPAAYCGVIGLKPTYGVVSRYGLVAFASSLDQIGPLTKTVEDSAIVLSAIAGHDKKDSTSIEMKTHNYTEGLDKEIKGIRIGVPKEYFKEGLSADVKASIDNAIKTYESLGAVVEETTLPTFDYALSAYYIISSAEATSNLSRYDGVKYGYRADEFSDIVDLYKQTRTEGFGKEVKRRIMLGNYVLSSGYYDAYYLKAQKVRTLIKQDFDNIFEKYDLILSPTTPAVAFKAGEKEDPMAMYMTDIYTVPINIAGLPAISIPCGMSSENMPIGMQLIGKPLSEKTILNAGHIYEQARGSFPLAKL
jgi:aspartyl-tRNA(Asn)/glutamyl-tRNA(Gln) amidotransferase subunit A